MKALLVGVLSATFLVACLYGIVAAGVAVGWFDSMKYVWHVATIGGLACGISAIRRYVRDGGYNWRSQLFGSWAVRAHEARQSPEGTSN